MPTLQREAEAQSLITVTLTGFFPPGPGLPRGTEEFFAILAVVPSLSLEILSKPAEVGQNGADPLQSGMSPEPADGLGPVPCSG